MLAAKGGRASGEVRSKKRDEKLDAAGRAYGQLIKKHEYTMQEPRKKEIEKAADLPEGSLRKINLAKIKARSDELRSIKASDE